MDIAIHTLGLQITGEDPVELALGGSETAVVSMARALSRRGCRVRVFCQSGEARTRAEVSYLPADQVAARLEADPCDLFLSCRYHQVLDRPLAARRIVLWHHDMPDAQFARRCLAALSRASLSLFLSRFHARQYEAAVPGLGRTARVTSNGVDFEALERVVAAGGDRDGEPRFLYGSRPERGLDLLLREVWPRIRRRLPRATLAVSTYDAGALARSPELEEYYGFCRELLEASEGVVDLGSASRRRFWGELARSTAVLYPTSFPEISCMVALEAQAAGVPIVTTDDFALSETVGFADTRIGAPWASAEYLDRFVEAAVRLAKDRAFHRRARDAGREHVTPRSHSWDALAGSWVELFGAEFGEFSPLPRPRVSATILVKDGEPGLRRSIESLAPLADEIVVGDTGSTDLTVEILASMGFEDLRAAGPRPASQAPKRLVAIGFCDFAQARNELARHATGDYIVWQDADEVLIGGDRLRRWLDHNVFYDAFALEQQHLAFDRQIGSSHPIRAFRRETDEGPLGWVGCVHELVQHGVNRPPARVATVADVKVGHFGYQRPEDRRAKTEGRNFALLVKDRCENPERRMGLILGIRECVTLARYGSLDHGMMTRQGYRLLNLAYEIWQRKVSGLPEPYRTLGWTLSQEILEQLAQHRLPLASTGQVPFQADVSFAARRGRLEVEGRDIPRSRRFYASFVELRREFAERLDDLERKLPPAVITRSPGMLPDPDPTAAESQLGPQLFGLDEEPDAP